MEINVGDIWSWTVNSDKYPNDSSQNIFLVLEIDWGVKVLYLARGEITTYTRNTFEHVKYLKKLA
jgi:hypothetical protein